MFASGGGSDTAPADEGCEAGRTFAAEETGICTRLAQTTTGETVLRAIILYFLTIWEWLAAI